MGWIDGAEAGSFSEEEGLLLGVEVRLGEQVLGLGVQGCAGVGWKGLGIFWEWGVYMFGGVLRGLRWWDDGVVYRCSKSAQLPLSVRKPPNFGECIPTGSESRGARTRY